MVAASLQYAAQAEYAAAIVLVFAGAAMSWASANAVKRVAGVVLIEIGALIALGALSAPIDAIIAGVAACAAQLIVGAAIVVRLQEAYGTLEISDLNAADAQAEPKEPGA